MSQIIRDILGTICIKISKLIIRLPFWITYSILNLALPIYLLLNFYKIRRLKKLWNQKFPARINIQKYYSYRIKSLLQCLYYHRGPNIPMATKIINENILKDCLKKNKFTFVFSLHMGPVEFLHKTPHLTTLEFEKRLYVMTGKTFSKKLTDYVNKSRSGKMKKILFNRRLKDSLKKAIDEKAVLATMLDQFPGQGKDRLILWNTYSLPFYHTLVEETLKAKGIFIPISTYYDRSGYNIAEYHPPLKGKSLNTIKKELAAFFEERIEKYPEQWNWSYGKIKYFDDISPPPQK